MTTADVQSLPPHLQKYIVEQDYSQYTSIDQACWRYVLRQLRRFLTVHAHEAYLDGLEKTGIEIERIPKIEDVSEKLKKFGWRALPVSGFIPPAAFMELQSLGVLPIASAMRSIDHLTYTPAPDIVHEAAGHAPFLIQPEFSKYLQQYAQVARNALLSHEDLKLYEAIRILSDLKENPTSTEAEIAQAQKNLESTSQSISFLSEAALLGRMNWWTAEYGLIGDLNNPKIIGAGLLSSVEESKWCLSDKVKKIPLSMKCLETNYDITEPQPQLFVAPDFQTMTDVLNELASTMAFQVGGLSSVLKSIQCQTVNTVMLNSGVQISGRCVEAVQNPELCYLRFEGPCQLAYQEKELPGHGKAYHSAGFGAAVGTLKNQTWKSLLRQKNSKLSFEFSSGVHVDGVLVNSIEQDGILLVLSFENCTVRYEDRILFDPSWGVYDLAVGESVASVFGGPADREAYGETDDFVAKKVLPVPASNSQRVLQNLYQDVRDWRQASLAGEDLERKLTDLFQAHHQQFPTDWLLLLESLELISTRGPRDSKLKSQLEDQLKTLQKEFPQNQSVIADGLSLAAKL